MSASPLPNPERRLELHSTYGPTADTGGLMQNHAPTIYAYESLDALLEGESAGGAKSALPGVAGANGKAVTERPDTISCVIDDARGHRPEGDLAAISSEAVA